MLAAAKAKASELCWIEAGLAELGSAVPGPFDIVVLAGNVMIFLEPSTEARTLTALAGRLTAGGLLVAGFSVRADRLTLERYDQLAHAAGLQLVARWATTPSRCANWPVSAVFARLGSRLWRTGCSEIAGNTRTVSVMTEGNQ